WWEDPTAANSFVASASVFPIVLADLDWLSLRDRVGACRFGHPVGVDANGRVRNPLYVAGGTGGFAGSDLSGGDGIDRAFLCGRWFCPVFEPSDSSGRLGYRVGVSTTGDAPGDFHAGVCVIARRLLPVFLGTGQSSVGK